MKRKVIIIGPAFPLRGGIANFNNALAQSYFDMGFDVQVYSFSLQYPSFLFPGTTQYEKGDAPKDFPILTCINSVNPLNWISIARKINKQSPDYVIIRYWLPFMAPCLGTISRLLVSDIKKISITDNIIPHEKRIGDNLFTKYFVSSCDAFVSLSQSVLKDLEAFTDTKNKIFIPHPIYNTFGEKVSKQEALKNLSLSENHKYLLFFGFIREYKGLDLLLQAISDNRIRDLGIKLIIAGEFYENKDKYLNMISELDIKDMVVLRTDFIPSNEVKNYFCGSDMITQTYKTATQSGITQIAYHFERPMLVTDVGGLSEIVPHNKVGYITTKKPIDIANAIYDFYSNDKEKIFSTNTVKQKEKFSWVNFIKSIDDLFSRII